MKQYQICIDGTWHDTVNTEQIDYYARNRRSFLRVKPKARIKNTITVHNQLLVDTTLELINLGRDLHIDCVEVKA